MAGVGIGQQVQVIALGITYSVYSFIIIILIIFFPYFSILIVFNTAHRF